MQLQTQKIPLTQNAEFVNIGIPCLSANGIYVAAFEIERRILLNVKPDSVRVESAIGTVLVIETISKIKGCISSKVIVLM